MHSIKQFTSISMLFWRNCLGISFLVMVAKYEAWFFWTTSSPFHSTFCFTTQDHVLFTLWRCQIINGFKGKHGKIWSMTAALVRLGIKLPMSSWIVSLGFLQGLNLACWVMVLGSQKNWWVGMRDCANKGGNHYFHKLTQILQKTENRPHNQ